MDFSPSTQKEKASIIIPHHLWKWCQEMFSQSHLLVKTYIKWNQIMKDRGFWKGKSSNRRPLALEPAMHNNTSCLFHRCLPFPEAKKHLEVPWWRLNALVLLMFVFRIISHRRKSTQSELPYKNNNKIPNKVFIKDLKLCLLCFQNIWDCPNYKRII